MRKSDSLTVTLIEEITLMINKTVETERQVEKLQIAQTKYIYAWIYPFPRPRLQIICHNFVISNIKRNLTILLSLFVR